MKGLLKNMELEKKNKLYLNNDLESIYTFQSDLSSNFVFYCAGEEMLKLCDNGDIYVRGKLTDMELIKSKHYFDQPEDVKFIDNKGIKSEDKNMLWWKKIRYFKPQEFDSPDETGSGFYSMNQKFIIMLDNIREEFRKPIKINSGYRTAQRNKDVGGKFDSAHRRGVAADIHCDNSRDRFNLIQLAMIEGIKRIGIGKTYLHLDIDKDKPQTVIWLY